MPKGLILSFTQMKVYPPKFNPKENFQSFPLEANPSSVLQDCMIQSDESGSLHGPDGLDESQQQQIQAFLNEFLPQTSKYFPVPLQPQTVYRRMKSIWRILEAPTCAPETLQKTAWIPKEFHVRQGAFHLIWDLLRVEEIPALQIPSGFLTEMELEEDVRNVSVIVGLEEVMPEMTVEESSPAEPDGSLRATDKRKIREARLRVALAKLRAERLAEKYQERYGDLEDNESELSSDSEGGDERQEGMNR